MLLVFPFASALVWLNTALFMILSLFKVLIFFILMLINENAASQCYLFWLLSWTVYLRWIPTAYPGQSPSLFPSVSSVPSSMLRCSGRPRRCSRMQGCWKDKWVNWQVTHLGMGRKDRVVQQSQPPVTGWTIKPGCAVAGISRVIGSCKPASLFQRDFPHGPCL